MGHGKKSIGRIVAIYKEERHCALLEQRGRQHSGLRDFDEMPEDRSGKTLAKHFKREVYHMSVKPSQKTCCFVPCVLTRFLAC